jgi:protein SCO1/2
VNRNSGRIEVKLAAQKSATIRGNSAWRAVIAAALLLGSPFFGAVAKAQFQYPSQNIDVRPELLKDVGIDQKLNNSVPLDLTFRDETGQTVKLAQFFGNGPVILSLVYYNCPMLCTQVLNGMERSLKDVPMDIGKQFSVVT